MPGPYYEALSRTFRRHFTDFDDPRYLEAEGDYKVAASRLAYELLPEPEFSRLLEAGDTAEIANRILPSVPFLRFGGPFVR